uniref:CNDH2_C domain-containing protein n=1 Tax=Macrostomum lignano TaxID=282301 RepID=A0A1I8H1Y2_9PLAT
MTSAKELSSSGSVILTKGQWYWKEDDNTLDFRPSAGSSQLPTLDKSAAARKRGGGAGKAGGRSDRRTPSAGGRGGGGKQQQRAKGGSGKAADGEEDDREITLADVKRVALAMMQEANQKVNSPWFQEIRLTKAFDDFLMTLLLHFHWFFEKRTLDCKVYPANVHKSRHEIQEYEDICVKVSSTEKVIGRSYCALILGQGVADTHHMAAGDSRVSATKNDREMIFRSDTFNLAMREKNYQTDENGNEKNRKLTPAEYRRMHPKRPAINDIVNQRSPALASILPRPKEGASWLYTAKKDFEKFSQEASGPKEAELRPDPVKFGILGDMMSLYNPDTLTPEGADEEAEKQAAGEGDAAATGGGADGESGAAAEDDEDAGGAAAESAAAVGGAGAAGGPMESDAAADGGAEDSGAAADDGAAM